jgi:hypothetical protein
LQQKSLSVSLKSRFYDVAINAIELRETHFYVVAINAIELRDKRMMKPEEGGGVCEELHAA